MHLYKNFLLIGCECEMRESVMRECVCCELSAQAAARSLGPDEFEASGRNETATSF